VTGSLAVQPFDILHEYASGLHVSECPSRVASARFRDEPSWIMRAKPRRPAAIVPRLDSVSALDRPITEDPAGCPNRPTILFVVGDPDTTSGTGETSDGLRSEVRVFRNFETPNFELRIAPFPHVSRCTLRPYKSLYSYAGGLSHSPARVVRKILLRRLFSYTSR
jgi:hypothetical protein